MSWMLPINIWVHGQWILPNKQSGTETTEKINDQDPTSTAGLGWRWTEFDVV
jgi:hypothetical protein